MHRRKADYDSGTVLVIPRLRGVDYEVFPLSSPILENASWAHESKETTKERVGNHCFTETIPMVDQPETHAEAKTGVRVVNRTPFPPWIPEAGWLPIDNPRRCHADNSGRRMGHCLNAKDSPSGQSSRKSSDREVTN